MVLDCGASAGGCSCLFVPVEVRVLLVEGRELVVPRVFELFTVCPGNVLAAISENMAVSATEPAISQWLARRSLCRAASRALVD